MGYIIKTHKGITFTLETELNLAAFVNQLNNRSLIVISISGMVLNKSNIKIIHPVEQVEEGEDTREVHTADGEMYITVIENFDADQMAMKLNDPQNDFVLVGDILIQKYNVDLIR